MIAELGKAWISAVAGALLLAIGIPAWLLWPVSYPAAEARVAKTVLFHMTPVASLSLPFAHPLFNPERKPLSDAAKTDAAVPAVPAPQLIGVVARRGGGGVALVSDADGKSIAVRIGASIGPWRLLDVGRTSAVFVNGADRAELKLDYSHSTANPDAASAAAGTAGTVPAPPSPNLSSPAAQTPSTAPQ